MKQLTEVQLEKIWYLDIFDSRKNDKTIMAEMPDYESYLKSKQRLAKNKTTSNEYQFMSIEPLLTREQEYHLFRQYNYLKHKYKKAITSNPRLLNGYLAKIQKVKNILIYANTKLIMTVLKAQCYRDFEVALSDGCYGLIHSVDSFDFRKGFKFATYAYWAIRSKIRYFSQSELKETNYVSSNHDIDLDECTDKEFDIVGNNEDKSVINEMLRWVSEREKKVVEYYYGLNGNRAMILEEIGQALKISKERVRQIREAALHKIQLMELKKHEEKRLSLCG